jgi:hypothetical protein
MTTEERLEILEKKLSDTKHEVLNAKRRNLYLLIGLVVMGIAWGFTVTTGTVKAQSTEDTIQAKEFLLSDSDGYTRAWLGMGDEGPMLVMYDSDGVERVTLDINNSGTGLGLYDDAEFMRASMSVGSDGPSLDLYDDLEYSIWKAP